MCIYLHRLDNLSSSLIGCKLPKLAFKFGVRQGGQCLQLSLSAAEQSGRAQLLKHCATCPSGVFFPNSLLALAGASRWGRKIASLKIP